MTRRNRSNENRQKLGLKRRTFLSVTGGVAVAAALRADVLKAQAAAQPKRLLVIFTPDGTLHDQWRPTGSGTDFTLPSILQPFESLRDDLLILDGVDNRVYGSGDGDPHEQGMTQMLTGRPNRTSAATSTGMSVDEYVHQNISGGRPALRVGVGSSSSYISNWTRMTFDANGSAIHPRQSPYQARDAVFPAGFNPGAGGTTNGPSDAELRERAIRQGAVGFAQSQLTGMAGKLRNLDRERIMAHANSLAALLEGQGTPGPAPTLDHTALYQRIQNWTPGLSADPDNQSRFPQVSRMHMELISAAFAFDRSRVAVMQFSESNSPIRHTWAGAANTKHHDLSHAGQNGDLLKIYRWYSEQIAWLANDLKTNGLLDNTAILWMSDMDTGEDHGQRNVPMMIIGGANHFNTGRYMNYRNSGSVSHTSVLTSICNAMGLPDTKFGARNEGPLTGVT